ncbi:MAG: AraC family transcriptional regulator ligand-binding domain-containing protein [Burkholderiales bacterium]
MRYMHSMVQAAVARGLPREQVQSWAGGISAEMLEAPRARVGLPQFSRLYAALTLRLQDEGAGLSSIQIAPGAAETMTRAGLSANSLGECAEIFAKSLNATVHGMRVAFRGDRQGLHITLTELQPIEDDRHNTYEVILFTAYSTMSWLFGRRPPLVSVDFPSPAPKHLFELRTLFAGPVRFNQPVAALHFTPDSQSMPVVRRPAEIPGFLRRAPASFIEALLNKGELALRVRQTIHDGLPALRTLNEVAEQLALSPRSLHRKLDAENQSFQKVKDELRRDLALHALTRTDTPLKQIALAVGFVDQASFQRAFLHWTGRPPGTWRRMASSAR